MSHDDTATAIFGAIHEALRATEKTREPMNALVVWTELGKGLAGKLDRQGADAGLLGRLIADYCRQGGGRAIDLDRWAYRVEPERRLTEAEAAAAIARAQRAVEACLRSEWGDGGGGEHQRERFLDAVSGWFPVGLDIVRSLPAFRGGDGSEAHAALGAWCARYLPRDTAGPADLGVRAERSTARSSR
jgi:hypothetical protein